MTWKVIRTITRNSAQFSGEKCGSNFGHVSFYADVTVQVLRQKHFLTSAQMSHKDDEDDHKDDEDDHKDDNDDNGKM